MLLSLATIILGLSILLVLIRFLTARTDSDRVIAVDVLGFQLLGMSILLAFHDQRPLGLQFAFAISLLGFFSTLVLSRLIRTTDSS
ncbi:MAG: monovalent cation/H+ antiporter complex subunit F [Verrucomicrobiota bacterium]